MKILKKFLIGCLFSCLFIFSVNAENIDLTFAQNTNFESILEQYPNWKNSKWVQEKAKEFADLYFSDYENVAITLQSYCDSNYSNYKFIQVGDNYCNIGFYYTVWNGNVPAYFIKYDDYYFNLSDESGYNWWGNSNFRSGLYVFLQNDGSFEVSKSTLKSFSSSSSSGFLGSRFYSANYSLFKNYMSHYNSNWNGLIPIVYFRFDTQDKFILPAYTNEYFDTSYSFVLPNGVIMNNINPIGFVDLMQDNYYNFAIDSFSKYNPTMYDVGVVDIIFDKIFINVNKNEFGSDLKGRIKFVLPIKYSEDFDLLDTFPLVPYYKDIDVIVDSDNSFCEESENDTTICTYDYSLSELPSGEGNFPIVLINTYDLEYKNIQFYSSIEDTKISSFIIDSAYCTNYDNDYKKISTITNPKNVTFIREGNVHFPTDIVDDAESLSGVFSFTWNEDFSYTESDFNVIFKNDSKANLIGTYDFKCLGNSCFIDYHYASVSSTLEYANIKFIVTMPSEETKLIPKLNVSHCPNNSVVSITYDSNSTVDTIDSVIKKTFEDTGLDLSGLMNMSDLIDSGPIDSILTLPLNVLQTLTNTLSGTVCTPLTIKLPFVNKNMSIPCINTIYEEINATTFFERVGSIASTIILINYFIFLYGWFEKVIRMEPMNIECWGFDNV